MELNKKSQISFGSIVATIGSILIGLGIIWLIAQNWHWMPSFIKILILIIATSGAYTAGVLLRINEYPKTGATLIFLGSLLYCASVFLIAQIFSTDVSMQGTANLFLLCLIGVILIAYTLSTASSLILGLIITHVWLLLQFFSIYESSRWYNEPNIGMLMLLFLSMGVLVYGIGLIHRKSETLFSKIYIFWTAFYLMLFTYFLTFQSVIPVIWREGIKSTNYEIVMLSVFIVLALISIVAGIFVSSGSKKFNKLEVFVFGLLTIGLIIVIILTGFIGSNYGTCYMKSCYDFRTIQECQNQKVATDCIWTNGYCTQEYCGIYWNNETACKAVSDRLGCEWFQYNATDTKNYPTECRDTKYKVDAVKPDGNANTCDKYNDNGIACNAASMCKWQAGRSYYGGMTKTQNLPLSILFIWILSNILFLGLILLIIGYGTMTGNVSLINIGIIFFAIDIISRYIGFIIDFAGYNMLAVIFITGGCILLFGGWLIEKWRRKMIQKARKSK